MKLFTIIILAGVSVGCSSRSIESACMTSSAVLTSPVWVPAVGSSMAYQKGVNSAQGSSIALQLPPNVYSDDITLHELHRLADAARYHNCSAPMDSGHWDYMGTRGDFHFLTHNEFGLGARKIYRIRRSSYSIDDEFQLTHNRKLWRSIIIDTPTGGFGLNFGFQVMEGVDTVLVGDGAGMQNFGYIGLGDGVLAPNLQFGDSPLIEVDHAGELLGEDAVNLEDLKFKDESNLKGL